MLDALFGPQGRVESFQVSLANKRCLTAEAVGYLKI